jgi:hypothetical protein
MKSVLFWVCLITVIVSTGISIFFLLNKEKFKKRKLYAALLKAQKQNELNKVGQSKYDGHLYGEANKTRKARGQL